MDNQHWLKYMHQLLTNAGVPMPQFRLEDFDLADGNSRDVQLVSIDDLLPESLIEEISPRRLQRFSDESYRRDVAGRLLERIREYTDTGENPNFYIDERDFVELNEGLPDGCSLGLMFTRNVFPLINLPNCDTHYIGSYRADNFFVLETDTPTTQFYTDAEIGEDFLAVNIRWRPVSSETHIDEITEFRLLTKGGNELLKRGTDSRKLSQHFGRMHPKDFLDRYATVIAETYRSLRSQ